MLDDPPRSWRVDERDSDVLEMALFVRDAAGLDGPAAPSVPRLTGVPLLGPAVLDDSARGVANRQWTGWFRQAVELERSEPVTTAPGRNRAQYLIARREAVCDPPDFSGLADRPELRAVARGAVAGHRAWSRSLVRPAARFDWGLLKQTAEDVAFDHRAPIDQVRARLVVLPVQGVWWSRVAPGCVICSAAAATDPVVAQTLVRDAFVSGLTR